MAKNKIIEENADLKKHSALTTYKVTKGNKLSLSVSKAIQAIYSKEQKILKENYRKNVLKYVEKIFEKDKIDYIMNELYSNKKIEFDLKINENKLIEFSKEVFHQNISKINPDILDVRTLKDKVEELGDNILTQIALCNIESDNKDYFEFIKMKNKSLGLNKTQFGIDNFIKKEVNIHDKQNVNEIINAIKGYCKNTTIKNAVGVQQLDFSLLSKMISVNTTRLKNDLKTAVETSFEFNYINKKNLDIDLKAAMLGSVKFTSGTGVTFLEYQIPEEILKLLLLPDVFADMKSKITFKFENEYSYNLYQFLKDNLYKGEVLVKKEELFNFLGVTKKARESKYELQHRVIIPAISELEMISDISVTYEFIPNNRWREIKFFIKENTKYVDEEIEIRKAKEELKDYKDSERIIKAIEKAKRNIYVSRSFKKTTYNKINKLYNEYGEDFVVLILNELYSSLNKNIETTLVQYINGMIKNIKQEARQSKKRLSKEMFNKTLKNKMENIDEDIIPTFKSELDVEIFLKNLPQNSLYKIQITKAESIKLISEFKKMGKSENFVNILLEKYYEVK